MPILPFRVGRRLGKDRDEEPCLGRQGEWLVELDMFAVEVGGEGILYAARTGTSSNNWNFSVKRVAV
jgi:hypothetical protein